MSVYKSDSDVEETEKFLKDNAMRLSLMLEAGNVFPWYADLERRRVEIGDELFETYGVKKDDFKDDFFDITTVLSRIHPDDRGIFDVVYKNLLEGKQHKIGIEIRLDLLNSGEYRWVDLKGIVQVFDEQGRPSKVVGFATDIQKRRDDEQALIEAKRRAEESDRLKSAFLANVSHEIRTPLNAIVGFSEIIANTESQGERESYLDIVKANSNLLLHLINDILDLSRLEANRVTLTWEECDVVLLCRQVVASVSFSRQSSDNQFLFTTSFETYRMETDIQRMQQVIINLLSNADKFTKKGKITLDFSVDEKTGMAVFSVTDTGCGIPKEKQKLVFERFEKLNEYAQGTGLGLSICKLIVSKWKGAIWIDPDYTGGARFIFSHPLKIEKE